MSMAMDNEDLCYRHSGAIGATGPVMMLVTGVVLVAALGAAYGYITYYIPLIYANFLITLAYGAAVGYAIGKVAKRGKVRNNAFVMAVGFLFGVVACYTGWVSWICAISEQKVLAFSPVELLAILQEIAVTGAWTIFDMTPTGIMLYVIWSIEAIMIIAASVVLSAAAIGDTPYCEECDRWLDDEKQVGPIALVTDKEDVSTGNISSLLQAVKIVGDTSAFSSLTLRQCSACEEKHYVTVDNMAISIDKEGTASTTKSTVVTNLIIDRAAYDTLKAIDYPPQKPENTNEEESVEA